MEDNSLNKINEKINNAFKVYYTLSHVRKLYKKDFNDNKCNRAVGVRINYEINIKRIDPKESDIETFFQKVERLKKMLKR